MAENEVASQAETPAESAATQETLGSKPADSGKPSGGTTKPSNGNSKLPLILGIVAVVVVIGLAVFFFVGRANAGVAAKVNGDKITTAQLQAQLDSVKKRFPQYFKGQDAATRELEFKQRLLDELINQKLIEQAAAARGIKVTDADVQKQIDTIKKGFKTEAAFESALKSAGINVDALDEQIRTQLVTQKLVEQLSKSIKTPTAAEIQAYYDSHKTEFATAAEKRASHIVVKDKATAEKLLAELQNGANFDKLAKANSIDTTSAQKGGDLGWPSTPYLAEFQAALNKLKVGQLSAVVQTQSGYEIIKVTDERAATQKKLAEVKAEIIRKITEQKRADLYQQLLKDLQKQAKIEIFLKDLKATVSGSNATTSTK